MRPSLISLVIAAFACANSVESFTPPKPASRISKVAPSVLTPTQSTEKSRTATTLYRTWNFNEGQGPWGMKKNAETWNGRVAQVAFVLIFLQELIQGKGVVQGLQDGDLVNYIMLGFTVLSTLGFTVFLALNS